MENTAAEARKKYMREYREKNAEHIREYQREYQRNYRKTEQGKASICRYWAKKAKEMGLVEEKKPKEEINKPNISSMFKKYYEWYQEGRINVSELALLSGETEQSCHSYIEFLQSQKPSNEKTEEEREYEMAKRWNKKYTADYRKANPEKVTQWRKNATVNAYKKLIENNPEYKIKENEQL